MKKISAVIDYNDIKTATIIHICVRIRYTHTHISDFLVGEN